MSTTFCAVCAPTRMLWALQLTTYAERLRFAEQEAMQAQSNAVEKTNMAKEVRLVEANLSRGTHAAHEHTYAGAVLHLRP